MTKLAIHGGDPVLSNDDHQTWPKVEEDERAAVMRVLDRGVLSGGDAPEARAFEEEFAAYVGTKHALLTHAGTSALQLAVAASGIQAGDEVIVPSYSFVATAICVLAQGAIPRFVDVDPETGNIAADAIEAAIGPRTRAIMPVHVHGCPADMAPIGALARAHDLVVIEDAAQAHGATYQGKNAGTLGVAAGFSMQSSKNLSAGEGGVFVTDDDDLLAEANRVRNFGQDLGRERSFDPVRPLDGTRALRSLTPGHMFRGNEMMAAFARVQLQKLPARTAAAVANAERLREGLAALPGVRLQNIPNDRTSCWHKVRVHLDANEAGVDLAPRAFRDAVRAALTAEGANAVLWQDHALPEHPLFAEGAGFGRGWPFSLSESPETLRESYRAANFPHTRVLLDSSIVLFSQTRPLIAQSTETVERYVEAFAKVWNHRDALPQITAP